GFGVQGRVFLNYRRDDTEGDALALFNRLSDRLGKRRVFRDLGSIEGGDRWKEVLVDVLSATKAVLILIVPPWVEIIKQRAAQHESGAQIDYVREEIETAVGAGKAGIIPVLAHGAEMPARHELPERLRAILDWQTIKLNNSSDAAWRASVAELLI